MEGRWVESAAAADEPARRSAGADLAALLDAAEHSAPTLRRFRSPAVLVEADDDLAAQGAVPDEQALTVDVAVLAACLERLPLHELVELSADECKPWSPEQAAASAPSPAEEPSGVDSELDALLATLMAPGPALPAPSNAGPPSTPAAVRDPPTMLQAAAVAQQGKPSTGGVTHVAANAPQTVDDLDALLGLL
ncbi:hypothetical protein WJX81_006979 [Elliptochloris bilobata]|uniref:Uncharacterized protein n=1 Tax=Elliptochloris bilobata TaxID=381761 RepID=A0AAW1RQZ2_9CHLO